MAETPRPLQPICARDPRADLRDDLAGLGIQSRRKPSSRLTQTDPNATAIQSGPPTTRTSRGENSVWGVGWGGAGTVPPHEASATAAESARLSRVVRAIGGPS